MITPAQVAETLKVSPATVRRWAVRFQTHLSPRMGIKRKYSIQDLDTFRRILDLTRQGYSLDKIDGQLAIVPPAPEESAALATLSDFAGALEQHHRQLGELQAQLSAQAERINALERWIQTPWYRRIGRKPPA